MADTQSPELVELVPQVYLCQVTCLEHSALRRPVPLGGDVDVYRSGEPRFELTIHTPDEGEPVNRFYIQVRLVVDLPAAGASAVVAYQATYEHELSAVPSIELLTDFTNEVALMILLPYLREALADVTRRVFDQALLMPMFQRGEVAFHVPDSPAGRVDG